MKTQYLLPRLILGLSTLALGACVQPPAPKSSQQSQPTANATPNKTADTQEKRPEVDPQEAARHRAEKLPKAAGLPYAEKRVGGAKAEENLPLIIALHGRGSEALRFIDLFDAFDQPARVVALQPTQAFHGGWSWFPIKAHGSDPEQLAAAMSVAAHRLTDAINEIKKQHKQGPVVLTGFSQGAMLSFHLAVHHPELVDVAIPMGGKLPAPLVPEEIGHPEAYPLIYALHGAEDPTIPIDPTRKNIDALKQLGLNAELKEYPEVGHSIPAPMREDLFSQIRLAFSKAKPKP